MNVFWTACGVLLPYSRYDRIRQRSQPSVGKPSHCAAAAARPVPAQAGCLGGAVILAPPQAALWGIIAPARGKNGVKLTSRHSERGYGEFPGPAALSDGLRTWAASRGNGVSRPTGTGAPRRKHGRVTDRLPACEDAAGTRRRATAALDPKRSIVAPRVNPGSGPSKLLRLDCHPFMHGPFRRSGRRCDARSRRAVVT